MLDDIESVIGIIGGLIAIIGALYAFYKWVLPLLKSYKSKHILPLSIHGKRILLNDKDLNSRLLRAKRDAYLGKKFILTAFDKEIESWKKSLSTYSDADQAYSAQIISDTSARIALFEKMINLLFEKEILEMLETWLQHENALASAAQGIIETLTSIELSARTRFDVWKTDDRKCHFAIYVFPDEKDNILSNAGVVHEMELTGPGAFYASELPYSVILRHVVPKLLHMIAHWKEPAVDEKIRACMLHSYSVGLG